MAKKRMKKRIRGSVWRKGKGRKTALGYYVRKNMSGPRRFRLRELVAPHIKHDFDSPYTAKTLGWAVLGKAAAKKALQK